MGAFSVAARLESAAAPVLSSSTWSARPNTALAGKARAGKAVAAAAPPPPPRLRDELLALVEPARADPNCAIFRHTWKKRVACEAAALAALKFGAESARRGALALALALARNQEEDLEEPAAGRVAASDSQTLMKRDSAAPNELFRAAEAGEARRVRALLSGGLVSASTRGHQGLTGLHVSARAGHAGTARMLLARGAAVDARSESEEQPLHLAAYAGHLALVELLLAWGADPDARGEFRETPLFFAARKGHAAVARALLYAGARANVKDRFGETAEDQSRDRAMREVLEATARAAKAGASAWAACPQRALVAALAMLDPVSACRAAAACAAWSLAARDPAVAARDGWRHQLRLGLHAPTARPMSSPFLVRDAAAPGGDEGRRQALSARPRLTGSSIVRPSGGADLF